MAAVTGGPTSYDPAPPSTGKSCAGCAYFASEGAGEQGQCCRYPAREAVPATYWCGEFLAVLAGAATPPTA